MDKKPNIPEANSPLMPLSEQDPVKEAVIKVATARKLNEVKRGIPSNAIPQYLISKEDESFGNDDDNNYYTLGGEA